MSGPLLFLLTSENLNSNEDAVLSDMRKKNIKDISADEEKYIKDFPEYYEDENIASRINILKTEWNKTERNNDIANYYSNKGTDISRGLGSFVGDFGVMIAGGIAGEIAISKATNTFRGNLNTSTNINNYKEFPNKVFINDGTPGGTTKAYQNITTYPDGSMSILQKNLTTGEISLQKINPLGQLIYEKSLTPYEANALIGTSTSTSALTQISYQIPVMNGATRAMQYSSQWENASLTEAINRFAPNAKPVETSKGKVIYSNNETGVSVVYDKNGNYFRIEDTTKPRGRNYLDINGNDMNNEIVNGKQRGRNRADYQRVTHFNNTD